MKKILVIEPQALIAKNLSKVFQDKYDVRIAHEPHDAIMDASDNNPDAVILELSLAGHSGLEFLYEFRTYQDWRNVPVIVYSSIQLDDQILKSPSWEKLNVAAYLYKPHHTLASIAEKLEDVLDEQ